MKQKMMIAVLVVGFVIYLGGNIFAQQDLQTNTESKGCSDSSEFQQLDKEKEAYVLFQMRSMDLLTNDQ